MAGMTQREYAAHRGVSQPAVSKAIKTGRIKLGPDGKIDPEQADRDWIRNTDPEKQANGHTGGSQAARTPPARAPTRPVAPLPSTPPPPRAAARAPVSGDGQEKDGPVIDFNRARTVKETFAAKLEELKYREAAGELVSRDAVKVGLFKVFTILKGSLMGIHSAARLQSEIPPRTVELIDNLCRSALQEAHKSLQDLADGKL